jgi:hypothetical protein
MKTAPDAVYVIIPCIKELGLSWTEIKNTPRHELTGLLIAFNNYNRMHQFDGYSGEDVSRIAKDKPEVRSEYSKCLEMNKIYERRAGKRDKIKSFSQLKGL